MSAEPALALDRSASAIRAADELGLPLRMAEARSVHAWALAAAGQNAEAAEEIRRSDEMIARTGAGTRGPHAVFCVEAWLRIGRLQQGLEVLEDALKSLRGLNLERANLLRLRGELALRGVRSAGGSAAVEEPAQAFAKHSFREAIDVAHAQGATAYELRAALALARLPDPDSSDGEGRAALRRIVAGLPEEDSHELREARAILERHPAADEAAPR
jgi:hypothetical protein